MLSRLLDWLGANRWLNFLILFVYFFAIVLPHEQIGLMISDVFRPYTRDSYNRVLLLMALGLFCVYVWILFKNKSTTNNKSLGYYFLFNLVLAVLCYNLLFVVNVEAIHFIQYGVFALLCFPLVRNYSLTLMYATLAGVCDEIYQFYYLAPERTDYYDFNDVVINLVGAVFGLLLIRSLGRKTFKFHWSSFVRSKHFMFIVGLILLIIILFATGILVKNYDPQNLTAKYWLIRKPTLGFWKEERQFGFKFHVIKPWEGLAIVVALFIAYSGLYKGVDLLNKE